MDKCLSGGEAAAVVGHNYTHRIPLFGEQAHLHRFRSIELLFAGGFALRGFAALKERVANGHSK